MRWNALLVVSAKADQPDEDPPPVLQGTRPLQWHKELPSSISQGLGEDSCRGGGWKHGELHWDALLEAEGHHGHQGHWQGGLHPLERPSACLCRQPWWSCYRQDLWEGQVLIVFCLSPFIVLSGTLSQWPTSRTQWWQRGWGRRSRPSHSSHDLFKLKYMSAVVIYAVLSRGKFVVNLRTFWV